VQVTRATFIPLLTSAHSDRLDPSAVREEAFGELTVVYTFGPDFGRRVVTHADLDQLQLPPQILRRSALEHLEVLSSRAEFHGQPPALMLSFEGLESSLLLATDFWRRLEGAVPGELVVGVPARDVVIVTGSQSQPGMEKAKRCVERVFFAGGENLVSRNLLVRRNGAWEPFGNTARPSGRPTFGPAHQHGVGQPPREFQEHQSWPGERVPLQPTRAASRMGPGGQVRRRPQFPMHPVAPAAQLVPGLDSTGSHRFDMTGSQRPVSPVGPPPAPQPRPESAYRPDPGYRDWAAEVAEAAQYSAVPYSSVPYSAAPYPTNPSTTTNHGSLSPQSVMPQSAVPYSALPYSQPPVRSRGIRGESGSWYPYQEQSAEPARPTYQEPSHQEPSHQEPSHQEQSYQEPSYRDSSYRDSSYRDASYRDSSYRDSSYQDESYSTGALPRSVYSDYAPATPEPAGPTYPASWGTAPDNAPSRPAFRTGPRARFQ
jgi:hypothetical protein